MTKFVSKDKPKTRFRLIVQMWYFNNEDLTDISSQIFSTDIILGLLTSLIQWRCLWIDQKYGASFFFLYFRKLNKRSYLQKFLRIFTFIKFDTRVSQAGKVKYLVFDTRNADLKNKNFILRGEHRYQDLGSKWDKIVGTTREMYEFIRERNIDIQSKKKYRMKNNEEKKRFTQFL